ncbi:PREDICTED: bifunctional riboflavin kinase/FMN [Prunus dulcis]|uniref:riboflavin kinase n=1 Tax=Prunus dulcis TaxID=3755 RepID=A0A5E4G217_PRUDU|nr:PREDICTED: bifunctional riboflavin kinase/FMN [Prunus dulcis]
MNALPVESPATLRRQTAGPLEQAGTNGFEELGLGLRFRLVELSVSVRFRAHTKQKRHLRVGEEKVSWESREFLINQRQRACGHPNSKIHFTLWECNSQLKMSTAQPLKKLVSCVILDLDGTLLNTDGIVSDVLRVYLGKYGKQWDGREIKKIVGKTPLEAASAVVEDYELSCTTSELLSEITPMFSNQWCNIKALPGANRLIKHLSGHRVPMALASNSPRENIETKISYHQGWKESFSVIIGGDEVRLGKPSPEIFLEVAKRLNVDPSSCLVIEDSLLGVTAGRAAGMEVVAVPSIPKQPHLYTLADEVINSLLDLRPEKWGLPPFQDWIKDTLPLEPWHIGGPVVKGFGRGSKVLGIPTANLSTEGYGSLLSEHPSGVYFGWAGLSKRGVFKMVMSIGWNPYFNNTEKTIEPWLLHNFDEDFYGEELRLIIVGYIRPEANFSSLQSLIEKIHHDRKVAEEALDLPLFSKYKDDPYLKSST